MARETIGPPGRYRERRGQFSPGDVRDLWWTIGGSAGAQEDDESGLGRTAVRDRANGGDPVRRLDVARQLFRSLERVDFHLHEYQELWGLDDDVDAVAVASKRSLLRPHPRSAEANIREPSTEAWTEEIEQGGKAQVALTMGSIGIDQPGQDGRVWQFFPPEARHGPDVDEGTAGTRREQWNTEAREKPLELIQVNAHAARRPRVSGRVKKRADTRQKTARAVYRCHA